MIALDTLGPSIRKQIMNSGVPFKSMGMEFSDLEDTPAKVATMEWVSTVQAGGVIKSPGSPLSGLGLLYIGSPGHGKTTLASVALQELIRTMPGDMRKPVGEFMDYPSFLRLKKASWADDEDKAVNQLKLDKIYGTSGTLNVDVLVLDDVGKEYRTQSQWAENVLDELLRARFNRGLPTIVTSNTPVEEWGKYGDPMESFISEAFGLIIVKAPRGDRRKNG
jgi:DNA replication protein DnaC